MALGDRFVKSTLKSTEYVQGRRESGKLTIRRPAGVVLGEAVVWIKYEIIIFAAEHVLEWANAWVPVKVRLKCVTLCR